MTLMRAEPQRQRTVAAISMALGLMLLFATAAIAQTDRNAGKSKRANGAAARDLRLVEAVQKADKVAMRALLKQGADVNVAQGDGATALHWAAYRDDQEAANLLIRAGAAVNAANDLGVTPLGLACENGSRAMIETLLRAGADPNAALPSNGETPLMTAARAGDAEAVKVLLAHGADVNARESTHGQTALMWAVGQQHADVARELIQGGADLHARSHVWRQLMYVCCDFVNVTVRSTDVGSLDQEKALEVDQGGFTPLLFAARVGDVESARLLLAAGANVNDVAPLGSTALVLAAHSGHGALAELLLSNGADPNAAGAGYTALHAAVLRGESDVVKALLARGANLNVPLARASPTQRHTPHLFFDKLDVGATPFLLAANYAEVEIMRVLAGHGADPRLASKDGTTPLIAAAKGERPAGTYSQYDRKGRRFRLTTGAEIIVDWNEQERLTLEAVKTVIALGGEVNATTQSGDTALHIAAYRRLDSVVQFLAEAWPEALNLKNRQGDTPLMLAASDKATYNAGRRRGADKTADLLRKLGAKE